MTAVGTQSRLVSKPESASGLLSQPKSAQVPARLGPVPGDVGGGAVGRKDDGLHEALVDGEFGAVVRGVEDAPPEDPDALAFDVEKGNRLGPPGGGLVSRVRPAYWEKFSSVILGGTMCGCIRWRRRIIRFIGGCCMPPPSRLGCRYCITLRSIYSAIRWFVRRGMRCGVFILPGLRRRLRGIVSWRSKLESDPRGDLEDTWIARIGSVEKRRIRGEYPRGGVVVKRYLIKRREIGAVEGVEGLAD